MFGAQQITAKPVVLDRKRHQVRICGLLAKNSRYLAFPTKNTENTEDYAALQSVKTGTNSAMPAQNVENYRFLLEGLLFARLTVSLRGFWHFRLKQK